ncbi:MAG: hypothetical protein IJ848_03220 [Alphaproteobacteria bacterium]|nr:hypothetical protein [Alphaproteobacteria bacterium]
MFKQFFKKIGLSLILVSSINVVSSMENQNNKCFIYDGGEFKPLNSNDWIIDQYKKIENFKKNATYVGNLSLQSEIDDVVLHCTKRVEYNPDEMWFDYQALFDKTKNKILGKKDNIIVRHVNFDKNTIAKDALFSTHKLVDYKLLNNAINGNIDAQHFMLENILDYLRFEHCNDENSEVICNYKYLLSILVTFGNYSSLLKGEYMCFANNNYKYVPIYIRCRSNVYGCEHYSNYTNFYAVARPIVLHNDIPMDVLHEYY